ncbi:MAG: AI-2E family transporter, partial [Candidatus Aminicenantes bacterium]|nr:AI-2E family transporter [Candidatus Aminicenantes bacterium]
MQGNKIISVSLIIIVIFLGGVVLREARSIFFPFFLAVFLSFILSPLLDLLMKIKIPKSLSIIFLIFITFLVIYLLGSLFYSNGKDFANELPKYGQKVNNILDSIHSRLKTQFPNLKPLDWMDQLDLGKIGGFIFSSMGPFFSFISNLFLVFIFLLFILAGRGNIIIKVEKYLSKKQAAQIFEVIKKIDSQIQRYLAIKTLVSFITGLLAAIILIAFGVEFAIVFGFLTFLLNYIPNIGSFIATVFPVFIAAFQFETIWPAFWILIILILVQQVMANFVEPRLMGKGLGLSPLFVLFALFFWGWLWGIAGMILAVPIVA